MEKIDQNDSGNSQNTLQDLNQEALQDIKLNEAVLKYTSNLESIVFNIQENGNIASKDIEQINTVFTPLKEELTKETEDLKCFSSNLMLNIKDQTEAIKKNKLKTITGVAGITALGILFFKMKNIKMENNKYQLQIAELTEATFKQNIMTKELKETNDIIMKELKEIRLKQDITTKEAKETLEEEKDKPQLGNSAVTNNIPSLNKLKLNEDLLSILNTTCPDNAVDLYRTKAVANCRDGVTIPTLSKQIANIEKDVQKNIANITNTLNENITNMNKTINEATNNITNITNNLSENITNMNKTINEATNKITNINSALNENITTINGEIAHIKELLKQKGTTVLAGIALGGVVLSALSQIIIANKDKFGANVTKNILTAIRAQAKSLSYLDKNGKVKKEYKVELEKKIKEQTVLLINIVLEMNNQLQGDVNERYDEIPPRAKPPVVRNYNQPLPEMTQEPLNKNTLTLPTHSNSLVSIAVNYNQQMKTLKQLRLNERIQKKIVKVNPEKKNALAPFTHKLHNTSFNATSIVKNPSTGVISIVQSNKSRTESNNSTKNAIDL